MRLTILTYGSQGDVQPCLALAEALQAAGHAPRLALPELFCGQAAEAGIPAVPLPGDIAELSRGFNRAGQSVFKTVGALRQAVEPVALEVARAAQRACREADLVVHTFLFTLGGHAFARQLGIPDVSVQFFPMFFDSASFPQPGFPALSLGPAYNRLTHRIGSAMFAGSQRLMYPRLRKAAPEFPKRLPWPFRASGGRAATPLLLACSPRLVPPEPDWGAHVYPTGFWFRERPSTPPPELVEFLEGEPEPVCVGFGSMIHPESARLQGVLLDGLRRAGQRAVILTGWDGWAGAEPGPDRLFLPAAAHAWLFPRCAAIVHHGGAGTTAAALRSGRPSVVLPLAADQFFWAGRIHASEVGPPPLEWRTLTAEQVAGRVRLALESEPIRQRAADMAAAVRAEDGLQRAVRLIEGFALGGQPSGT